MSSFSKKFSLYLIVSLFLLWGFLTVFVDSLIPRLKEIFELSYFEAGLVKFSFFIAYGLTSIPSGDLLQRIGYKKGIVQALFTMGIGCLLFIPAAAARWYLLFLIALFVLAWGMTILQVAANPYVYSLGDSRTSSSRFNIAQGFNAIGTAIAPVLGAVYLLEDKLLNPREIIQLEQLSRDTYYQTEALAVQEPFMYLGALILLLAIVFHYRKLPELRVPEGKHISSRRLLRNKGLRYGFLGIFLYVGCEVAIGSYLVNYFLELDLVNTIKSNEILRNISATLLGTDIYQIDGKAVVGVFVCFYWGAAMIGRFVGGFIIRHFKLKHELTLFGLGAISMLVLSIFSSGILAMCSILAVGFFNSIMFPTIFALSIDTVEEEERPQASGLLCTAIAGGAIIPPLFGFLIDKLSFNLAFVLIIVCYGYIAGFSRWRRTSSVGSPNPAVSDA